MSGFHPTMSFSFFSQRARLFPTDLSKINYIIGLLRGQALAWAQASAGTHLGDTSLDTFLACFERIFDRPNYVGCAGDRLSRRERLSRPSSSRPQLNFVFLLPAAEL